MKDAEIIENLDADVVGIAVIAGVAEEMIAMTEAIEMPDLTAMKAEIGIGARIETETARAIGIEMTGKIAIKTEMTEMIATNALTEMTEVIRDLEAEGLAEMADAMRLEKAVRRAKDPAMAIETIAGVDSVVVDVALPTFRTY
ncbi:hypothetical protein EBR78_10865 [bacterium]|nr:hypothetical protein [bacterium]